MKQKSLRILYKLLCISCFTALLLYFSDFISLVKRISHGGPTLSLIVIGFGLLFLVIYIIVLLCKFLISFKKPDDEAVAKPTNKKKEIIGRVIAVVGGIVLIYLLLTSGCYFDVSMNISMQDVTESVDLDINELDISFENATPLLQNSAMFQEIITGGLPITAIVNLLIFILLGAQFAVVSMAFGLIVICCIPSKHTASEFSSVTVAFFAAIPFLALFIGWLCKLLICLKTKIELDLMLAELEIKVPYSDLYESLSVKLDFSLELILLVAVAVTVLIVLSILNPSESNKSTDAKPEQINPAPESEETPE